MVSLEDTGKQSEDGRENITIRYTRVVTPVNLRRGRRFFDLNDTGLFFIDQRRFGLSYFVGTSFGAMIWLLQLRELIDYYDGIVEKVLPNMVKFGFVHPEF